MKGTLTQALADATDKALAQEFPTAEGERAEQL